MNLDELRCFLAVVDTGNFVKASDALGVPRATLRRRIEALEVSVGQSLLLRSREGATPTSAGQVLSEGARRVLRDADALRATTRATGDEPSGVLRVALPSGVPAEMITPFLISFRARFPKVVLHARFYDDSRRWLLDEVDAVIHVGRDRVDGPWATYHLTDMREGLWASPRYLARRGTPESLADLGEHDVLNLFRPPEDPTRLHLLDGSTHHVEPVFSATDPRVLRGAAAACAGIAMCVAPPIPVAPSDDLVAVLPDLVGRVRPLRLIVPRTLVELPALRAIFRFARIFMGRELTES